MSDVNDKEPQSEVKPVDTAAQAAEITALKKQLADKTDELKEAQRAAASGLPDEVMKDARRRQKMAGGGLSWEQCVECALRQKRLDDAVAAAAETPAAVKQEQAPAPIKPGAGKGK